MMEGFGALRLRGGFYKSTPTQSLFRNKVSIEAPVKQAPMKVINGVEIPDISFMPDVGEHFYIPAPTHASLYNRVYCYSNTPNEHQNAHGLRYPDTKEGKEASILHSKAMLGICPHT